MAHVTIPNRPAGTDQRSIEAILANFDAITNAINGLLDQTNLALGAGYLEWVVGPGSGTYALQVGQIVAAQQGTTVTLPAPVLHGICGVIAYNNVTGTTQVTVNYGAGAGAIYGKGVNGLSSIKIGTGDACIIFISDGASWDIISGEQDTGYVPVSVNPSNWLTPPFPISVEVVGTKAKLSGSATNQSGGSLSVVGSVPANAVPAQQVIGPAVIPGVPGASFTLGGVFGANINTIPAVPNLASIYIECTYRLV